MLHSICQQIWKTQQWLQDWKGVFTPIPKKGNAKECSNYYTITLISHASKVMLKILQASFNSAWTVNFQMFRLDLETAEEAEIKLPTSVGSLKKQENSRKKKIYFCFMTMPKPLTVWITTNCGKFFKRWEYKDHLTCLLRNVNSGQEATVRTGHGTVAEISTLGNQEPHLKSWGTRFIMPMGSEVWTLQALSPKQRRLQNLYT